MATRIIWEHRDMDGDLGTISHTGFSGDQEYGVAVLARDGSIYGAFMSKRDLVDMMHCIRRELEEG